MLQKLVIAEVLLALMTISCGGSGEGVGAKPSAGLPTILVVGDSISQGRSITESYRWWLAKALTEAGVDVGFVGSQRTAFDGSGGHSNLRHEAYWGWTTDEILARWGDEPPFDSVDIAIVHLGTNDLGQGEAPSEVGVELTALVALLRRTSPGIRVILFEPIPSSLAELDDLADLGAVVRELALILDRPEARVVSVDGRAGFDVERHTWDGVHPNERGAQAMAENLLPLVLLLAEERSGREPKR